PLQTPLVTSQEVPLEAYSSWSDLKEAVLDEDEIPVNKNMKNIESIANAYVPNKKRKRSVNSEERPILTKVSTSASDTRSSPVKKQKIKKEKEKKSKLTKRNKDNKPENSKKDGSIVEVDEKDDGIVDSDEEVDAVMEAIMCSKPQPLVTRPESYVPPTSNYFIYNDLLPEGVA
ncbi:14798_t:CDS:2, partial [Racocetra fulgida]